MERTLVVLPDGTEIFSGAGTVNAVQSAVITHMVNEGQELTPGSACAAMAELRFITPAGGLAIGAGDVLTIFRVDQTGARRQVGVFTAEKPTRPSANCLAVTAYDRVAGLDKDLTDWLEGLTAWPYPLEEFAQKVCAACGLTLLAGTLPNGSFPVRRFSARGITGRRLIKWIGQIACRFLRADPQGRLLFDWYSPAPAHSLRLFSASWEDYTVAPVQKVRLRQSDEDVGTLYPDSADAVNTYTVTANPLVTAADAGALVPVAQTILTQLAGAVYTPGKVSVSADVAIPAGSILSLTDANGVARTLWVMKAVYRGGRTELHGTGSPSRESTGAVNSQSFEALSGKVLNLRTDVDGIRAENRDTQGRVAKLELNLDGIQSQVSRQEQAEADLTQKLTALEQTAEAVTVSVETLRREGVSQVATAMGYTFDDSGLRIAKSGQQMENLLDNTGMYVRRSGKTLLQANADGVSAADVTVNNYLIVGSHARLEDYSDGRTACFYR